jgi:hypothetical protein
MFVLAILRAIKKTIPKFRSSESAKNLDNQDWVSFMNDVIPLADSVMFHLLALDDDVLVNLHEECLDFSTHVLDIYQSPWCQIY